MDDRTPGTLRLGRVGGTAVNVSSSWLLIAALIAVVVAPQAERARPGLGAWAYVVGVVVAVVLYAAVLVHELSHVLVVRRYGHHVPSVTLSFMGGRTAVDGEARTPGEEALEAGVGPIVSLAIGGLAFALHAVVSGGIPGLVVLALAWSNLGLGALNLVPVLPLDGGRVLKALVWRLTGSPTRGVVVAAWAARVAAAGLVLYAAFVAPEAGRPLELLDLVVVALVALFLWAASTSEIASATIRARFAAVVVRDLARRALLVPTDLPLAEAVRRARDAEAGAIVTVDSRGTPVGVVHEALLHETPPERQPWVPTSSVARVLEAALFLPVGITGDQLLLAINRCPAPEYVLVDGGTIFGVLSLNDVDRAIGPV